MADKQVIRLTNTEAVVKFYGAIGSQTIDLDVDLKGTNEAIVGTPRVNICSFFMTGAAGSSITITRNSVVLYTIQPGMPAVDLAVVGSTDSVNNEYDIVITSAGAVGQLMLRLRKETGFKTMVQSEQFSIYDDPASLTA